MLHRRSEGNKLIDRRYRIGQQGGEAEIVKIAPYQSAVAEDHAPPSIDISQRQEIAAVSGYIGIVDADAR